jgi:hypothetical protein
MSSCHQFRLRLRCQLKLPVKNVVSLKKQVLLIVLTMKTLSKSLNINRTVYCQNTNKQEYRWFTLIQGLQCGYLKETSVVRYFSRDTMYITLSKSIYEIMQTKIVSIKRAEHGKWKKKWIQRFRYSKWHK